MSDTGADALQEIRGLAEDLAVLLRPELEKIIRTQMQSVLNEYMEAKRLLTVADVAERLMISPRTVEKIVRLGKLNPLWIEGQRRFPPDSIDAYLRSCSNKQRRVKK